MNGKIEAAFTGKVIKDPEFRLVKNGEMPLLSFLVVVGDGEAAQFIRVVCFKETALALKDRLKKGSSVYCEGSIRMDAWEKEGVKRNSLSLAAYKVEIIGAGNIGCNKPKRPAQESQGWQDPRPPLDDDMPF